MQFCTAALRLRGRLKQNNILVRARAVRVCAFRYGIAQRLNVERQSAEILVCVAFNHLKSGARRFDFKFIVVNRRADFVEAVEYDGLAGQFAT